MEADLGEEVPHDVSLGRGSGRPAPEGGAGRQHGGLPRALKMSLARAVWSGVSHSCPKGPQAQQRDGSSPPSSCQGPPAPATGLGEKGS